MIKQRRKIKILKKPKNFEKSLNPSNGTPKRLLTVIIVPGEILPVDEEVVVLVQLPELAVDHVEVLVAEEFRHLNTKLDRKRF